jgi:hypothetical protein
MEGNFLTSMSLKMLPRSVICVVISSRIQQMLIQRDCQEYVPSDAQRYAKYFDNRYTLNVTYRNEDVERKS